MTPTHKFPSLGMLARHVIHYRTYSTSPPPPLVENNMNKTIRENNELFDANIMETCFDISNQNVHN